MEILDIVSVNLYYTAAPSTSLPMFENMFSLNNIWRVLLQKQIKAIPKMNEPANLIDRTK